MNAWRPLFFSLLVVGGIGLIVIRFISPYAGMWSDIGYVILFGGAAVVLITEAGRKRSRWKSACAVLALILMGLGITLLLEHHVF